LQWVGERNVDLSHAAGLLANQVRLDTVGELDLQAGDEVITVGSKDLSHFEARFDASEA